jgi:branched-chain amino acid transport system ATP-binding protein
VSTRAHELLEVFGLRQYASDVAGSLPYGSQRRLEIARALMLRPELLLLDEPAAGMNSQEAHDLQAQIRFLRDEMALTVVLVEHNMSVVMGVCEQIHVVDHGQTIAEGPPAEIKTHPKVLAAYLGQEEEEAEA